MANNFNIKKSLLNQNKQGVVSSMLGVADTKVTAVPYNQLVLGDYKKYEIDDQEVKDLANSIASVGLEQNLVVKETDDPNRYMVVTGHKRTTAIRYIFENEIELTRKVRKSIETPMCIVIPKDEDDLITRFRMHETNVHQRRSFTISELEDYINTIEEAKQRGLEVNGKKIKGTTRQILTAQFGMSETTAKKYIKVIKEGNPELKAMLDNGEISVNNAYDILMGNSEPIVNIKDEDETIIEEKIQAIAENLPKEKKEKEVTLITIKKSNKKTMRVLDKLFDEVERYQGTISEETLKKVNDAKELLLEISNMIEKELLNETENTIE